MLIVGKNIDSIDFIFNITTNNYNNLCSHSFQLTFGNTMLHYAAVDDRVSLNHFTILLSHPHISIDAQDVMGKKPLHYLFWFLHTHCEEKIRLLLKAGANVNAIGNDGNDPLKV